jgi:hypothetical protein
LWSLWPGNKCKYFASGIGSSEEVGLAGANASTGLENDADPDTRHPTLCHVGLVQISPVLSPLSFRADAIRATLARARSMARGSAALDNPGSQAQSGMLEHGEHDRGAGR